MFKGVYMIYPFSVVFWHSDCSVDLWAESDLARPENPVCGLHADPGRERAAEVPDLQWGAAHLWAAVSAILAPDGDSTETRRLQRSNQPQQGGSSARYRLHQSVSVTLLPRLHDVNRFDHSVVTYSMTLLIHSKLWLFLFTAWMFAP